MINITLPRILYHLQIFSLSIGLSESIHTTSSGNLIWLAKRKHAIIAELVLWNVAYNLLAKRHKWYARQRSSLDYRQTSSR